MKRYTIEQFKKYLLERDSLGDAIWFLDEKHIEAANRPILPSLEEVEELDGDKPYAMGARKVSDDPDLAFDQMGPE